jgi:hypothetical protein
MLTEDYACRMGSVLFGWTVFSAIPHKIDLRDRRLRETWMACIDWSIEDRNRDSGIAQCLLP